ncbi:MAG: hypothetical protein ACREIA_10245 [Opitutaceae bacterium]
MSTRLRSIGSNPTLANFARDASQGSIRKISEFLAPTVEVPTLTGQYKQYTAANRYKRANTKRGIDGKATRIGFSADDANYNLVPRALDFPIPNVEALNDAEILNMAMYGTTLLADAAGLDDEAETLDLALSTLGAGTDVNFLAASFDPIDYLDGVITDTMKAAKNGAPIRVLFGISAWKRVKNNSTVIARFNGTPGAKVLKTPDLSDVQAMLIGKPEVQLATMVEDTAAEGVAESISFMLDAGILVFACNARPNTMDPSFMKTFRLMGGFMKPGSYTTEDDRDEVLKMDWIQRKIVTNSTAGKRINANAT